MKNLTNTMAYILKDYELYWYVNFWEDEAHIVRQGGLDTKRYVELSDLDRRIIQEAEQLIKGSFTIDDLLILDTLLGWGVRDYVEAERKPIE